MRVHILQVMDGDINATDIFNPYGVKIISAGTVIKEHHIDILIRNNIDMLDILEQRNSQFEVEVVSQINENDAVQEIVPLNTVQLESQQAVSSSFDVEFYPEYKEALRTTNQIFEYALNTGKISHETVENTVTPLLEHFHKERDVVSLLLQLNNDDDYTCQHSLQVCMLSYYLSLWLGYTTDESLRIGKAGYLHDIGKCRIDRAILNKPAKLSKEEFETIKTHTTIGEEIIKANYTDDWLSISALQHHERMDGTGYPHGVSGNDIHPIAKIIAVADVYSAMISTRVYRDKKDLFSVLHEMYVMSFNQLDPHITHTFIRQMLPNFLHKRVKLNDGRTGTIVMNHATEFFKPLVKIDEEFIDLSMIRQVEIAHVYM